MIYHVENICKHHLTFHKSFPENRFHKQIPLLFVFFFVQKPQRQAQSFEKLIGLLSRNLATPARVPKNTKIGVARITENDPSNFSRL